MVVQNREGQNREGQNTDVQKGGASVAAVPEDIRPAFRARADAQLFTCLHCPTVAPRRNILVVICQSAGHEYERSHRALRQLAGRLAAEGFHCLRLDYGGTGDSSGDPGSSRPQHWPADVTSVLQQAIADIGQMKVILLGHRIGASIAARVALDIGADGLVLWNVAAGRGVVAEWDDLETQRARALGHQLDLDASILGAPMSVAWRADLSAMALPDLTSWAKPVLSLGRTDAADMSALLPKHARHLRDAGGPIWRQEPLDAIVPFASLQQIIDWLVEQVAHDAL